MSPNMPVTTTNAQWKPYRPDLVGMAVRDIAGLVVEPALGRLRPEITHAIAIMAKSLNEGHLVWWFGNGGSAAQAEHFAAELVGRFRLDREPLGSMALTASSATLTALANDYDYGGTFKRTLSGVGRAGDVAVGLTTSGRSNNVLEALRAASKLGLYTIAMVGGGDIDAEFPPVDVLIVTPDTLATATIQEEHLQIGHLLCGGVEQILCGG